MTREMTALQFMSRLQDDVGRFKIHVMRVMREKPGLLDDSMSHVEWMRVFIEFLDMAPKKKPRPKSSTHRIR